MQLRRAIVTALVVGTSLTGTASTASAASPVSLLVSQSVAFAALGHSCGGIEEQAFATGFDATSGDPSGAVYVQTRCGGSGRGGGYHVTTYSAWIGATWDFTGATITSSVLATSPSVDPAFVAYDANGNELANSLNAVNVDPSSCTVGNTTYCTYRAWLTLAPDFVPPPRLTAISVAVGPSSGGTNVTITGTGFTGATAVDFGATAAAAFTVISDTSITTTSPAAPAGTVDVTVTTGGGTSATSSTDSFRFVAAPTITLLQPRRGPTTGGTKVKITGTGFLDATSVSFGGNPAGFTINSDTSITAFSPAIEGPDVERVTVSSIGGTSPRTTAARFTYFAA
jgi:hypothetical protein